MSVRGDFWSRRKARVEAEEAEVREQERELARIKRDEELAERTDEELLAELDLPDPDAVATKDELQRFMTETVPERLRRRALRALWRSNPVLANVDGLVEYGEDYTDSATVIENLQTAYEVGKGMASQFREMFAEPDSKAEPEEDDLAEDVADASSEASDPNPENASIALAASDETEEPAPLDLPRRSMRFTFEDT
ncbi:Protein of unknown function [Poseidonocella pacifica]|uniref:DUF3306 domain-containing protein n=1 Tax=Poseidonocella pacifica TaxID=871651 RepID=A0A1I0WTD7_9RHOB|nr:DUF3306 domain-containing protein [Poseidonocella pacifica]SFA91266.1 Protein of unknown function [Poseidonocella pacifica]